jgi:hypothetical protein
MNGSEARFGLTAPGNQKSFVEQAHHRRHPEKTESPGEGGV